MVVGNGVLSKLAHEARFDPGLRVPCAVIQPFFEEEFADQLYDEFPTRDRFTPRYSIQGVLQDLAVEVTSSTVKNLAPSIRQLDGYLHSGDYGNLIEQLTGVAIDPALTIISLVTYEDGKALDSHIDHGRGSDGFLRPVTHVLHLTKDWAPQYGGQFTLSEKQDLSSPVLVVDPAFNMSVMFKRVPDAWHSVTATNCPENYRKTVAIVAQARDPLSTLYGVKRLAKRVLKRTR